MLVGVAELQFGELFLRRLQTRRRARDRSLVGRRALRGLGQFLPDRVTFHDGVLQVTLQRDDLCAGGIEAGSAAIRIGQQIDVLSLELGSPPLSVPQLLFVRADLLVEETASVFHVAAVGPRGALHEHAQQRLDHIVG